MTQTLRLIRMWWSPQWTLISLARWSKLQPQGSGVQKNASNPNGDKMSSLAKGRAASLGSLTRVTMISWSSMNINRPTYRLQCHSLQQQKAPELYNLHSQRQRHWCWRIDLERLGCTLSLYPRQLQREETELLKLDIRSMRWVIPCAAAIGPKIINDQDQGRIGGRSSRVEGREGEGVENRWISWWRNNDQDHDRIVICRVERKEGKWRSGKQTKLLGRQWSLHWAIWAFEGIPITLSIVHRYGLLWRTGGWHLAN